MLVYVLLYHTIKVSFVYFSWTGFLQLSTKKMLKTEVPLQNGEKGNGHNELNTIQ